jgi:tetratricopeptide (TPR) repeat protein
LAVGDAERIRSTSETRKLRQRITNGKEREDWIQRGDSAMLDKDYTEAASAYEKANQIWATTEIEKKARTAAALLLVDKAQEALDKGDLLAAERHLQSSMWKSPTQQVSTRLEKLAPAFEAARLVQRADQELHDGNYAEAQRLFMEAIPSLPPPADAAAKNKLVEVRQNLAIQRGDEAYRQEKWQAALEAYQEAKNLGRNGDVTKKIDAAKAKLQQ